jgi:hypothetical protein
MTRWTSPDERRLPTITPWGERQVGESRVVFRVSEEDLTDNMYGSTTPTHDFLVEIENEGQITRLGLPGRLEEGLVLEADGRQFLVLRLVKNEYVSFDSNAQHDVQRQFLLEIPQGACWVKNSLEWKTWNRKESRECLPIIQEYLELRAMHRQEMPRRISPRLRLCSSNGEASWLWRLGEVIFFPVRLVMYPWRWLQARQRYQQDALVWQEQEARWQRLQEQVGVEVMMDEDER